MLVGILTLIISVISVLNHQLTWLLAIFPGLFVIYAYFIAFSKAPALQQSLHLTRAEQEAWQQHHAFFRFPFASRQAAGALSLLQFMSIALAIAFAATGEYLGLLFVLGWFVCAIPVSRLNPTTTYVPAAQKGNEGALRRVEALGSLRDKLHNK